MFGALVSCAVALVFPLFASYRALAANDISLLRPWLMYWVVLATCLSAESVLYPLLQYLPFYGLLRLAFLSWLVLPQTQGAIQLYMTRLEPWLSSHDQRVDSALARAIAWLNEPPQSLVVAFFGIELPKPRATAVTGAGAQQGHSMTDMLMSRFRIPVTPDLNLSAYLPAFLSGQEPPNPEDVSQLRSRVVGMLRTLDAATPPSAASSQDATQFSDDYDIVDSPRRSPSPPQHHTETEIEREVEASIAAAGAAPDAASSAASGSASGTASGTAPAGEQGNIRKRWW